MAVIAYRPAVDGLRTVAVLSVFIFHLNHKWLPGGFVGVDVFFVISGFLITSIIHGECLQHEFSLARFYQRRIARIFPAFLTAALATLLAAFFFYSPQDLASCGANLAAAALSVANIKLVFQGNYFTISPDAQPLLHYWSLSVEEQFYLLFPLGILLLHRFARRALAGVMSLVLLGSFAASVALTRSHPAWAFFLLPTRGWELLAGALLAVGSSSVTKSNGASRWDLLAILGLVMILGSFFVIREGAGFPGWIALLPVVGSVLVIGPNSGSNGVVERFLAQPLMVFIGKLSYSLYLWHWPVFSLIDYGWFQASGWQRLPFKVGLSFGAAIACHKLIETPARKYLSQPGRRRITFVALALMLALFVGAGVLTRKTYYLNATEATLANGGIVIGKKRTAGSIALIGDSNGSMYGTALRQLADDLQYKLTVLSAAAGDLLPRSDGKHGKLWLDAMAAVTNSKPAVTVLVCQWPAKLSDDQEPLRLAIEALSRYTRRIVLITTPPILPANANRQAIRSGARPPFFEDVEIGDKRREMNQFVKSLHSDKVVVLDVEPLFQSPDGGIRFTDGKGRLIYQDAGHLSHYGAALVMPALRKAIESSN
jgi:peptidoglycan/LPS O-acetylase OafA/YrhL